MCHRHAILMGTSTYEDSRLRDLSCPERDVAGLEEILQSPDTGQFDSVSLLINQPHYEMARAIHKTLNQAGPEDLVLLYYSGHGKLNHFERLFLAATNTEAETLESTALPVHTIRELIDVSSCRRVVLLLDCCYSGAAGDVFVKGGVEDQLQQATSHGRGTYIITASTAIEAAQEKEGEEYSVFTKHLIHGLRSGEADRNHDGRVTVDELYDYVRKRVVEDAAGQEPSKWGIDVRSELVIAQSGRTPRKDLEEAVRARLLELMQEDLVPDEVYTTARKIFAKPAHALTPTEQSYEGLLIELRDRKLRPGRFLVEWGRASKTAGSALPTHPDQSAEPQESVEASRNMEAAMGAGQAESRQATEAQEVAFESEELTAPSEFSMPYWLEESETRVPVSSSRHWLERLTKAHMILVTGCALLMLLALSPNFGFYLESLSWFLGFLWDQPNLLPTCGVLVSVILAWASYYTEAWRVLKQSGWGALLMVPLFAFARPIWYFNWAVAFLWALLLLAATVFFVKYSRRTLREVRAWVQSLESEGGT